MMRLPKYKVGACRQPGAALRRTLLYRHDEASDLDLGGA
jgi:hypothetical protein